MPPVIDPYPFPPLPKLQPSDPNPNPFEDTRFEEPDVTDLYPEFKNTQPRIPTAQAIYPFDANFDYEVEFVSYPYPTGNLPGGELDAEFSYSVVFADAIVFEFGFEVEFIPRQELFATYSYEVEFQESEAEPGLFAYWPLEGAPWNDEETGANHLTAMDADVIEYYDAVEERVVAEFSWKTDIQFFYYDPEDPGLGGYYNDMGGPSGYLERNGNNLSIYESTGRWSFKVTFDLFITTRLQLVDSQTGETAPYFNWDGTLMALEDQWQLSLGSYPGGRNLFWGSAGEGGGASGLAPTEEWVAIELEFNATTNLYTMRCNGVLFTGSAEAGGMDATPGDFYVGVYGGVENWRIKELKYYKIAFVANP